MALYTYSVYSHGIPDARLFMKYAGFGWCYRVKDGGKYGFNSFHTGDDTRSLCGQCRSEIRLHVFIEEYN